MTILASMVIGLVLPSFAAQGAPAPSVKVESRFGGTGSVKTGTHRYNAVKLDYFAHLIISRFCPDLPAQNAYSPKPAKLKLHVLREDIVGNVQLAPNPTKDVVELSAQWGQEIVDGKTRYDYLTARSNFGLSGGQAPGPVYLVLEYDYKGQKRTLTIGRWTSQKPPTPPCLFYAPEYVTFTSTPRISIGWDLFPKQYNGLLGGPPGMPAAHFWPRYCKLQSMKVLRAGRPSGPFKWTNPMATASDPRQGWHIDMPGSTAGQYTIECKLVAPRGFQAGYLPKVFGVGFYPDNDPAKGNRADNHVPYTGEVRDGYPAITTVKRIVE